jgi:hypothetical protein
MKYFLNCSNRIPFMSYLEIGNNRIEKENKIKERLP